MDIEPDEPNEPRCASCDEHIIRENVLCTECDKLFCERCSGYGDYYGDNFVCAMCENGPLPCSSCSEKCHGTICSGCDELFCNNCMTALDVTATCKTCTAEYADHRDYRY